MISSNSSSAIFALGTYCYVRQLNDEEHEKTYPEIVMGEPSVFQYAEPQVSRVLSQVASHTLEQRCIQQHSVHGLLPHYWVRSISISIMNTITDRMSIRTESSTFSILSPHVQLELTGALLLPNVLRTHGKELPTNLINRIFVFFSSDHCKGIKDISLYC